MKIDRAGWPFILGALILCLALWLTVGPAGGVPLAALTVLFLFFFRDPARHSPSTAGVVVSPADGRVLIAGAMEPGVAPPGEWQQVSIFLSPLDVHVNRIPAGGRITRVEYRPGRALPAYKRQAADVNERSEVWIDHHGQTLVARQVVGILARRVVCRVKPGDEVYTGERFGVMKFGSRMDVFLPMDAAVLVRVGDTVRGGETPIAALGGGGA